MTASADVPGSNDRIRLDRHFRARPVLARPESCSRRGRRGLVGRYIAIWSRLVATTFRVTALFWAAKVLFWGLAVSIFVS